MTDDSQPVPENITAGKWDPETWKSKPADEAIHALFAYVDNEAGKAIAWYVHAKGRKATLSRVFRGVSIVLFVFGGLTPIAAGIAAGIMGNGAVDTKMIIITQSGYLMLGLAAGLLAFDRYFGTSSGWIRYMTSLAAIERLRAEFLFDWTGLLQKAPAAIDSEAKLVFLTRAQVFQKGVSEIVEKETAAWVAEFQSSIADLEKAVQTQRQAAETNAQAAVKQHEELRARMKKEEEDAAAANQPGAVNIEVVGDTGSPVEIFLDGKKVQETAGRSATLTNLPKGQHAIEVRSVKDGKPISASKIIKVEPGSLQELKLTQA